MAPGIQALVTICGSQRTVLFLLHCLRQLSVLLPREVAQRVMIWPLAHSNKLWHPQLPPGRYCVGNLSYILQLNLSESLKVNILINLIGGVWPGLFVRPNLLLPLSVMLRLDLQGMEFWFPLVIGWKSLIWPITLFSVYTKIMKDKYEFIFKFFFFCIFQAKFLNFNNKGQIFNVEVGTRF